jgi:dolichol-phosphate mannosyltransferase
MEGQQLNPAWEVPAFRSNILAPRTHDFALVIPVLNEGDRIQAQLARIRALRPAVDVVVADGGSTDGALRAEVLAATGVNTMLVKEGPGSLSAQLRMAFAFCCARGYRGIVTMDGNGKDGVDAIQRFVETLEQGYGLVQGSRYRPGGLAENTPFDRWLAGRLVHAPIVSLATRQWFTDTTNGFRGYATAALLDPRVAPFRDIFDRYNLLFYLSVRLPRLGWPTIEIPVVRRYPPSGRTPTKIAGLGGRLGILNELLAAASGRYNPS